MAEPYRILYLIESLGCGGAEKRLVSDLRCLDQSRFNSIVCHLYPSQVLAPELKALDIPVYNLGLENVYQGVRALRGLLPIIRRHRIHLIHTQLFGADLYGRLAGRVTGKPVVTTIQSTLYDPSLSPFFSCSDNSITSLILMETIKASLLSRECARPQRILRLHPQ